MKKMAALYMSDIFKIFYRYESSRLKIWQIVRTYDPIELAKLIYLLENVTTSTKRDCLELDDDQMLEFCRYKVDFDSERTIQPTIKPTLSLERVTTKNGDIFWNEDSESPPFRHPQDLPITEVMENIRSGRVTTGNIYEKLLQHNLGSRRWQTLLLNIKHNLFMDNLHTERNEYGGQESLSNVTKFLKYHSAIHSKHSQDADPRGFRSLIVMPVKRILDLSSLNVSEYILQPAYQGFRFIVYQSDTETKCYNRYGEIMHNLGSLMRNDKNCTFEAIILPIDKRNVVRSWRYWPYKKRWVMYIVDVYRFEQTVLINAPFSERIKYADTILSHSKNTDVDESIRLAKLPRDLDTYSAIEAKYIEHRDLFDPIVGVIYRKNNAPATAEILEYKFNIRFGFNMIDCEVVNLPTDRSLPPEEIQRLFINLEMADYKTICIAYAHCKDYIYLCDYNRNIHQFVHFAKLKRLPQESCVLMYRPEFIYVVGNQTLPLGVLFLRVYYDCKNNILGYDTKISDSRYNVPYENELFKKLLKTK